MTILGIDIGLGRATKDELVKRGRRSKRKGSRNEHRTIRLLEQMGYRCTRAAGSLGEFDVVAIGRNDMRLVQVKSNAWPGPAERETIELVPAPQNAIKELWRWDDRKRAPRVQEWLNGKWAERAHYGAEEMGL